MQLVINAKHFLLRMNVLNAILIIIALKNFMEIVMANAFAKMVIMMIININHANNALHFGLNILLLKINSFIFCDLIIIK